MNTEALPGEGTFNAAIREAVQRRGQWSLPIAVWLYADESAGTIRFDARANTVPPGDRNAELFLELDEDGLSNLAGTMDDPAAFDALVTEILRDQMSRREDA